MPIPEKPGTGPLHVSRVAITEGLGSPSADSEEGAFTVSLRDFLLNKPALCQTRKALCERFMSRM